MMKKVFSILVALIVLLAGTHLTLATHYCGGSYAASLISFSGELATCGMEKGNVSLPFHGIQLKSHCCDDIVSTYNVDDSYSPSGLEVQNIQSPILQVVDLPVNETPGTYLFPVYPKSDSSPPGLSVTSSVNLANICIFRI